MTVSERLAKRRAELDQRIRVARDRVRVTPSVNHRAALADLLDRRLRVAEAIRDFEYEFGRDGGPE
ncbi:MAG: hypothetical protein ACRD2Z_03220 [Thermoanaerobaculia bacterium]